MSARSGSDPGDARLVIRGTLWTMATRYGGKLVNLLAHPLPAGVLMALVVLAFDALLMGDADITWLRLALNVGVGAAACCSLALLLMRRELDTGVGQLRQSFGR